MAVGRSGNQFKNAPVVGAVMAELIDRVDHDRDPVRLETRYKNVGLNLGFYSRLRELNPDSSYSVNG